MNEVSLPITLFLLPQPQNILLGNDGCVKLADFGLSRVFGIPIRQYTHEVVTLWYRAPEILLGESHYTTAIDVWSAGCLLYELLTRKILFPGDSEIDQIFRIFRYAFELLPVYIVAKLVFNSTDETCRVLGTPTENSWPGITKLPQFKTWFPQWPSKPLKFVVPDVPEEALDLLQKMLHLDPKHRISAHEALKHPYLQPTGPATPSTPSTGRSSAPHSAEDPQQPLTSGRPLKSQRSLHY
eukprot:gb/GECG01008055.1/.p1 GENE.gb/GECG01008055.1/~~gb/GECG01008055.1/.p1  ORF type:complete len:240 (+),score=12.90 gb/GECG01008055.1/:1-720(+)